MVNVALFKTLAFIGVGIVGLIELLKNVLPAKVKENTVVMTSISSLISLVAGVGYGILFVKDVTPIQLVLFGLGEAGIVQVCYDTLLKTFKAVVAKLKANATIDELSAESFADELEKKINEAVAKALEEK